MTTSIVCGSRVKSKRRLYRGPEPYRMDPHFIQLESQLAALRNQRHPSTSATKFPADASPLSARLTPSPAALPKFDAARKSDTRGLVGSSLSSPSSSSSLALSQGIAALQAEACARSPSSSLTSSSSSCSVDSATTADKHDIRDSSNDDQQMDHVTQQSRTSAASTELAVSSEEQRQSNAVAHSQQRLSLSSSATPRRRSMSTISEERSRFRVVKIDSYVDRGRWHCHNFADPPMHDDDISSCTEYDSGAGAVGGDDSAPSQIYYIAAGQNDGDLSDLSKKFYVSTIVYGVHGHPVLDRTVRMSPLQLLRRTSDDTLPQTDTAGATLTPTSRDNDWSQSPAETTVNHVGETDEKLRTTSGHCGDVLPADDNHGHVACAPDSSDVVGNDWRIPSITVATATYSSMPPILTSCSPQSMTSLSDNDGVSRRAVTSLSLCQQDDAEMRCHSDSLVQPACLTRQPLSVDESHLTTRFALYINFNALRAHELASDTRHNVLYGSCMFRIGIFMLPLDISLTLFLDGLQTSPLKARKR